MSRIALVLTGILSLVPAGNSVAAEAGGNQADKVQEFARRINEGITKTIKRLNEAAEKKNVSQDDANAVIEQCRVVGQGAGQVNAGTGVQNKMERMKQKMQVRGDYFRCRMAALRVMLKGKLGVCQTALDNAQDAVTEAHTEAQANEASTPVVISRVNVLGQEIGNARGRLELGLLTTKFTEEQKNALDQRLIDISKELETSAGDGEFNDADYQAIHAKTAAVRAEIDAAWNAPAAQDAVIASPN